jgi:hypothetical protein
MGGIEMAILIAGGAFFGAILGRIFQVFVLIPTVVLAIALHLVRREVAGHAWLDSFLGIGLLIASLVLGYVTGLISTDISAAAQVFRGFFARCRRPASSRPTHLQ